MFYMSDMFGSLVYTVQLYEDMKTTTKMSAVTSLLANSINHREHSSIFTVPTYSHKGVISPKKRTVKSGCLWGLTERVTCPSSLPETGTGHNITGAIQTFLQPRLAFSLPNAVQYPQLKWGLTFNAFTQPQSISHFSSTRPQRELLKRDSNSKSFISHRATVNPTGLP